ncbi:MAG: hypothetical protein V5A30_01300 [Haloarculaceae archaeon]
MDRLRALGYSGAVSLAVFVYLALPTLRELYGPVVNLPVYVLLALVAGGATWAVLTDSKATRERRPAVEMGDDTEDNEDVDEELARLREDL